MSRAAHLLPLLLLLISLTGLRAQTPPTETPSPLVTTPLDIVDATDGLTSLREAILHLNAGLIPDTILFALPLGSCPPSPRRAATSTAATTAPTPAASPSTGAEATACSCSSAET